MTGDSSLLIPVPYRVVDKVTEGHDVCTLHVVPVDGAVPGFAPAQIGMLGAFGVGEAAISISSRTDNREFHAYTVRRAGPITAALVDTPVGGTITVRGPFGVGWPLDRLVTRQLAIIGGGLGIAPLRAVIHEAIERRDRFDRVAIVYGAKTPESLIYRREYAAWEAAGAEVWLTVDQADNGWNGQVGVVPELLEEASGLELDGADTSAFVCGPDVMMHFTAAALRRRGVPADQIWLTLERNMQCGNALCGHCQLGPFIVCRDGPVINYAAVARFHQVAEL